jgi:hypothetical protein
LRCRRKANCEFAVAGYKNSLFERARCEFCAFACLGFMMSGSLLTTAN